MAESKELAGLFEAFYANFVLRDLFGKIVPGFVALAGTAVVMGKTPKEMVDFAKDVPALLWLIAFGLAWLAGFAVQNLGEWFGLIRYYPGKTFGSGTTADEKFYRYRMILRSVDTEFTRAQAQSVERLVVIREACGNGAVALGLLFIMQAVRVVLRARDTGLLWGSISERLPVLVPTLLCAILLLDMHRKHRGREHRYYTTAVTAAEIPVPPGLITASATPAPTGAAKSAHTL